MLKLTLRRLNRLRDRRYRQAVTKIAVGRILRLGDPQFWEQVTWTLWRWLTAPFRYPVLIFRLLRAPRTVMMTVTYYNHTGGLSKLFRAMRFTPRAIPVLICNGPKRDKVAAIARGRFNRLLPKVKVIYTNNEYLTFTRQKLINETIKKDKSIEYVVTLDDDTRISPHALDDLLKLASPKRLVSFWGFSLKPPFNEYYKGRIRAVGTRCHFLATVGAAIYPAAFHRELKIPKTITKDMMDMEDIWLSYQAFVMGYEQYGIRTRNWWLDYKLSHDPNTALFLKLGNHKTVYWNSLFTPEFIRSKGTLFEDIWRETVAVGKPDESSDYPGTPPDSSASQKP